MPEFLTRKRALELLREVVAEFGEDHVYRTTPDKPYCRYAHGNEPGCGVGHVFSRAGMPVEYLRGADRAVSPAADSVPMFRQWATPEALALLAAFQAHQDQGRPWGECLRRALAEETSDE
jgi:hypothetical protein